MKQFIKDVLKEFFEPLKWKVVRIMIVLLVIGVALMAFSNPAEAAPGPDEHFRNLIPTSDLGVPAEDTTPPILYTEPSVNTLYTEESHPDEYCLALNIYYEARADNLAGKYAVADVVLNRVHDARFPNTVCEVIREGVMLESWSTMKDKDLADDERVYYPKRDRCQFSWYCDGLADIPDQQAAWRDAQIIAYNIVQYNAFRGLTEGATHYHATYVSPSWSLVYRVIGRVGEHIFYRWI